MNITPFDIARKFIGIKEVEGTASNPLILAMLRLDANWVEDDAVAWCSAWLNFIMWLFGLPRSHSLAARSWLLVGTSIPLTDARVDADVVILSRGDYAPGPSVIQAPGHVGLYAGQDDTTVSLLGGNQGDSVNVMKFPKARILGIRRLA